VALADGVLPATSSDSWEHVNLYNKAGNSTWPITMMTYMYVRRDLASLGETGTLLKVCDSSTEAIYTQTSTSSRPCRKH
jgi:hypothetical protein